MKILKKSICATLLTIPSVFPGETTEGVLIDQPDWAVASTTGIAADSPKSDISLSYPTGLVISTTTTLASMLPHLAEASKNKIEDIIAVLQGDGNQKFKEAETLLRACEITLDERADSPVCAETANELRSLRVLNQDILGVIRSLGVYIRDLPTEDDYDADVESGSTDSGSSKDLVVEGLM